ncbi:MAG TPA: AI-2E family transporter [Bacteroidia bacterium]|nr:AI-2E family transporter [Bacteroidia bacterium]
MTNEKLQKISSIMIIFSIGAAFMYIAASFLIPIAWAFLFSFVLHPLVVRIEAKGLSRSLSTTIGVLLFVIVAGGLLYVLVYEATVIITSDAAVYERLGMLVTRIQEYSLREWGIDISQQSTVSSSERFKSIITTAASALGTIGENLLTITLIPMYLFFLLNYRALIRKFIRSKYTGKKLQFIRNFVHSGQISVENYIIGTMVLTLVTGVMTLIILYLFGIKYALFFSVFMAILNLIPYIGNLIAFVFVLIYVYITKESVTTALTVGIILYLSNLIQENFLRPILVGNKMEMNAMVVFTGVIIGGVLWGVSGMVLFIPFLGILKSLLIHDPKLAAYAVFFEEDNKPYFEPDTPESSSEE